jgi:hypothetical protein
MKIAIVGTTANLSENEEKDMKQYISLVLKKYSLDTIIISGGAKGVDTLALEIAKTLGFKTQVYNPQKQKWQYYKKRNLEIASDCDELHCFAVPVRKTKCYHHDTPQKHEKTAGCWTGSKVMQMDKPCQLVVVPSRELGDYDE